MPPAQLLVLLKLLQPLLLLQSFQPMHLSQLQVLQFLEDVEVSKIILMLLIILKMLQKFTGIDCSNIELRYQDILDPKISRKIHNIYKDFKLYQLFLHKFLYQNVLIFPLDILFKRRINTLWSDSIEAFWSEGDEPVSYKKSQTKDWQYLPTLFELYQLLMAHVLLSESPEIRILHTIQSSCYLTKANNLSLT